MQEFCRTLRSDFQLPSRRTLQRRVDDVYLKLRDVVEKHLTACKMVTLAIDGWSDHQRQETLAVVAKPLLCDSKPLLVKLGHLGCRPSAENLQQWLGDVHHHLTAIGVRTIAVIADNAPNITNALKLHLQRHRAINLNCLAHAGNFWLCIQGTPQPFLLCR